MQKESVLVTLANENYVNQAKQLFSSAYFRGGWSGDMLLLSDNIPDSKLLWFRKRKILVYKISKNVFKDMTNHNKTILCKIYIFRKYFTKWSTLLFLDADILIRADLSYLSSVKTLSVVNGYTQKKIIDKIKSKHSLTSKELYLYEKLEKIKSFNNYAFNSGVIAFPTNIIKRDTFSRLYEMCVEYNSIVMNDEAILSIYFRTWRVLPIVYNMHVHHIARFHNIEYKEVDGIILHFVNVHTDGKYKPWEKDSYFYNEWLRNFIISGCIGSAAHAHIKKWSESDISKYVKYLKKKKIINFINFYCNVAYLYLDNKVGKIGLLLQKYYPKTFYFLNSIKRKF